MQQVTRELQVEALPTGIPEHVVADISALEVGGTVRVEDLAPIEGVTFLDDPQLVLATCSVPRGIADLEEEAEGAEGEEAEGGRLQPRARTRTQPATRSDATPLPPGRGARNDGPPRRRARQPRARART